MSKKLLLLSLSFFFIAKISFAEVVKDINIIGNKRITKETIIVFGNIKKNSDYQTDDLNNLIKELYKTNFFSDIKANITSGTLNIIVVENKIIQSVQINGIKAKKITEKLKEILFLKDKKSYVEDLAKKDLAKIKNVLRTLGYYFVEVKSSKIENDNNTINLIYDIELGEKALISDIKFIGDKIYKDRKLHNVIVSEENKFWKIISNKKYLNKEQVKLDKRLLKNFYVNKGYYQVKIESSSAQFLDKNEFNLVFKINAGSKFTINNAKLELPADYNKEHFSKIEKVLQDLKNETYSYKRLENILNEIDRITLNKQYEFINAVIDETILDENKLDLTIVIQETEKSYVERIDIFGNNITQERVIRNELEVDEGDPFNKILHNKSLNNLKARNIFSKVKSEINTGSTPNQKIIKIEVEEQPTGEITLGAGVGTTGTTIGFSVSENNYMGKGIKLSTSLQISDETIRGLFSVTNPNFNYSDNSITTTIESTTTDRMAEYGYETNKTGFLLGINFEQYDDLYIFPRLSTYYETLETSNTASASLKKQEGNYFDTILAYDIDLDRRNQRFQTSDGFRSTFIQSFPLISENYAILNGYEFATYHEIFDEMIASASFYSRAINSMSGDDVRISNRVFLPSRKLRGFESGKIGPVDSGDFVGGNYATSLNFATTLPMLLPSIQSTDFKLFFDVANVWGIDYSDTIDESNKIRSAAGIAVDWFTPIGPLNFSLSQPITKASSDKTETFRFNLGTTF